MLIRGGESGVEPIENRSFRLNMNQGGDMTKTILASISLCAALLAGCADTGDYGQGAPASVESDGSSGVATNTAVSVEEPGVAPEPGTAGGANENMAVESRFDTLGSASSPSANVPANVITNASEAPSTDQTPDSQGSSPSNEQGTQTSPEPKTGDDANPDSVHPDSN